MQANTSEPVGKDDRRLGLAMAVTALLAHRVAILSLPHFQNDLTRAAAANIAIGLVSDLSLAAVLVAVSAVLRPSSKVARSVAVLMAALWVLVLAAHYRYVEYFGFTLRPIHLAKMTTFEAYEAGGINIAREPVAWVLLLLPPLVAAAWVALPRAARTRSRDRKTTITIFAALVATAILGHAIANKFKAKPYVNRELRFNPVAALYFNWAELKRHGTAEAHSPSSLTNVRALLHGTRSYADDALNYPLWQTGLSDDLLEVPNPTFSALKQFLAAETQKQGPWNVILVLSESLRQADVEDPALVTRLPKWLERGISFTDFYSAGLHTSHGQLASQCSVYNPGDLDLLFTTPRTHLACLSDVFHARGSRTFFFYGSDNSFDNQRLFYEEHHVDRIGGAEDFPSGTPTGSWGVSDRALFEFSVGTLRRETKPFFATILSLSNHAPPKVPPDAPPGAVDSNRDARDQVSQYVDWTLSELLSRIDQELPHTLVLVTADHGIFRGESVGNHDWSREAFRSVTRIPLLLYAANLPEPLRGVKIDSVSSLADVPPTLLALLGWGDAKHQFMGWNAFDPRPRRILINWQNALFSMEKDARNPLPADPSAESALTTLVLGDMLIRRGETEGR